MKIPEDFTPMQKVIVQTYINVRNTPKTAELTFHNRNSSYVRSVIRKYKDFLKKEDDGCIKPQEI